MSAKRDYIEDLTNFKGSIHELKLVVDYIYEHYGWHANIEVENKYKQINFVVSSEIKH